MKNKLLYVVLIFNLCSTTLNNEQHHTFGNTTEEHNLTQNETNYMHTLIDHLLILRKYLPQFNSPSTPYEKIFLTKYEGNIDQQKKTSMIINELIEIMKANNAFHAIHLAIPHEEKYKKAKSILDSNIELNKNEAYSLLLLASAEGNINAKVEIAWGLLFGIHMQQNIYFAKSLFKELAEDGNPEGHMGLGFLHATGIGLPRSIQRSLVHLTMAVMGDSYFARMALGYRYWQGLSVTSDCEKALRYYEHVAKDVIAQFPPHGTSTAQRISILEENDDRHFNSGLISPDVRDYYEMLAEKGDVNAQIGLGQLYYRGARGLPRNVGKALHYFKMAASTGNSMGIAFVGKIYLEGGENVHIDVMNAYTYLKRAADLDDAIGETGLGKMFLEGKYVTKNYQKAFIYFSRATSKRSIEGTYELAKLYVQGLGVQRDFKNAKNLFQYAGQSGHIPAFYYLGQLHANGMGTTRSCTAAVELLKAVAERGSWVKLFSDGYDMYKKRNYEGAFAVYSFLAELGYSTGQTNAAFLLEETNISINLPLQHTDLIVNSTYEWIRFRKALLYWSRSALQGYPRSIIKMGDYHFYGTGTDTDFSSAALYYKFAAERHMNAQAMYNLGYMHENGFGLSRDFHLARRCYNMALQMSDEAWIPVGLAIVKLSLLEYLKTFSFADLKKIIVLKTFDQTFGPYWDVIVIVFLASVLFHLNPN